MNITHEKDVSFIPNLLALEDDIEDYITGDRGEWIQYLTENVKAKNERLILLTFHEEGSFIGYMVLIDGRQRPISDCLYILFVYSTLPQRRNIELWFEVIEWIKQQDLPLEIKACTKSPALMKVYGFVEDLDLVPIKLNIGQ